MRRFRSGPLTVVDGEALNRLRLDRGWSQETLARRAGVSLGIAGRIERGRPTSAETVDRLAAALGVAPGELIVKGGR